MTTSDERAPELARPAGDRDDPGVLTKQEHGPVLYRREGKLARIMINRPDAHNGIDLDVARALFAATVRCEREDDLGAVLIESVGRHFSVGGDLRFLMEAGAGLIDAIDDILLPYHQALDRLAGLEVPVVCAVKGATAGGALGLPGIADIVIAADDMKLTLGFSALALSGDGGSTWFLPRMIGLRRALDLYLTNRVLTADEALDWGIVTRVVPAADLERDSVAIAQSLASGPTAALAATSRLLRQSSGTNLAAQLAAEHRAMLASAASAQATQLMRQFFDSRS